MSPSMPDPYATLGVNPEASNEEIKKAYRKLAKRFHPDSTGGDKKKEARFKDISSAYDVLGDPKKRAQYDEFRGAPHMPPGFRQSGPIDLGEVFAQMFGREMNGAASRGGDGFSYQVFGDGGFPSGFGGSPGSRFASHAPQAAPASRRRRVRRRVVKTQPVERKVRASDGSPMVQKGSNVFSDVRIDIDQAILGAVVDVPTLEGKASVKVPAGTASGAKLRLRGKGPIKPSGGRGNHVVTIHIDVPKNVDSKATKLLVDFMRRVRNAAGKS